MVSMLTSNAVDHGSETRSGQTKDYEIGICCFSAKQEESAKTGCFGIGIMCPNGGTSLSADCRFSGLAL